MLGFKRNNVQGGTYLCMKGAISIGKLILEPNNWVVNMKIPLVYALEMKRIFFLKKKKDGSFRLSLSLSAGIIVYVILIQYGTGGGGRKRMDFSDGSCSVIILSLSLPPSLSQIIKYTLRRIPKQPPTEYQKVFLSLHVSK